MSDIILPESKESIDPSKLISPEELNTKINVVFATLIHPETKEVQIVINQSNKYVLWAAWKDMEEMIKFHLHMVEEKKRATSIQSAPASILERLNGKD
jgi:hypothetical protein